MSFLASLSPPIIVRQLRQHQEAATFERLQSSQHVTDLRLIFSVTLILMVIASILALLFCFEHQVMTNWKEVQASSSGWIWPRLVFSAIADSGAFIGAVWAVGCGVLAWTYQTGSARLGVVDLFACEIATLCRVAAVVDMVPRYIALFREGPEASQPHKSTREIPVDGGRFTSQEEYFPVFGSSVRDLQQLEAEVVDNVTAFYTYMKVMRDALRKLAELHPSANSVLGHDGWHSAVVKVIYMQFLALESARKSIKELVEFPPTREEDIFTILLSKICAYSFLRQQFKGDLRHRLLEVREAYYRDEVPKLCHAVSQQDGQRWDRAKEVALEVMQRCSRLLPKESATLAQPSALYKNTDLRESGLQSDSSLSIAG